MRTITALIEKITLSAALFAETVKVSPVSTIKIVNGVKLSSKISVCCSYCRPSLITVKFIGSKLLILIAMVFIGVELRVKTPKISGLSSTVSILLMFYAIQNGNNTNHAGVISQLYFKTKSLS